MCRLVCVCVCVCVSLVLVVAVVDVGQSSVSESSRTNRLRNAGTFQVWDLLAASFTLAPPPCLAEQWWVELGAESGLWELFWP